MFHLCIHCRTFNLNGCYRVTNKGISDICCSLPNLQSLNILNCGLVTENVLENLANLKSLQYLKLGCAFWPVMSRLPEYFPSLKCLTIQREGVADSTDEGTSSIPTWTEVKIIPVVKIGCAV